MFGRALLAFLALPGMVGGLVPALIFMFDPWKGEGFSTGYVVMGFGICSLLWCVRDFYVSGKGTLAPWSPPQHLVSVGLYRYLRNPMYGSVLVILVGWCMISTSMVLIAYALFMTMVFHIRVMRCEEPWLERTFGSDWLAYSSAVGRWVPRSKPWSPEGKNRH